MGQSRSISHLSLKMLTILESVFRILFLLFDHKLVLSQHNLLADSPKTFSQAYPLNMKMYLLQNIVGAFKMVV